MRSRFVPLALLAALTLISFWGVWTFDFLTYDDNVYVVGNPDVEAGLSAQSLAWALRTGHAANWHPVTWWSHQLDAQFFGNNAGGHHVTNLLLHVLNTLLVFWVFRAGTGRDGVAWFVAAMFGLHPVHVESVAWVAERKDVLSTTFWMLCMLAHTTWVRGGDRRMQVLSWVALGLGLATKPMLVTVPFVLILWDRWPLRRSAPLGKLALEKWPMFALGVVSSVVTLIVQDRGGAMDLADAIPLGDRLANAAVAPVRYLATLVWPHDLVFFYPHPSLTAGMDPWSAAQVGGSLGLLAAISIALSVSARKGLAGPLVGWLWFLGTLVPVLGLVQVGGQSMANRYAYVPTLGIFLAVALLGHAALRRTPWLARALVAAAVLACTLATRAELPHWKDSFAVYQRAIAVDDRNWLAHNNLGAMVDRDLALARKHYGAALEARPEYVQAMYNLGSALMFARETEQAIPYFERALARLPNHVGAQNNLGMAYARLGRFDEAARHLEIAVELEPDRPGGYTNLSNVLRRIGREDEARLALERALQIDPDNALTHDEMARLLLPIDPDAANRHADTACRLTQQQNARFLETQIRCRIGVGDVPAALRLIEHSLALARRSGDGDRATRLEELQKQLAAATREEGHG